MELGRHEASLRATINGAIERTKQPDSEALLSEMQAGQLAEHIQDVAREHAGAQAGNSPTPQKSSGGTSAHSGKTDSQLNHESAKLTAYSNIKNEERLEMVNGAGQPAHVTDVCVFAEEVAKNFVLMEGSEPLCEQLEQRKTRPSRTYEEFVNNGDPRESLEKIRSALVWWYSPAVSQGSSGEVGLFQQNVRHGKTCIHTVQDCT